MRKAIEMTEYETKNQSAKTGDYIVYNNWENNPMEKYVVPRKEFEKLYVTERGRDAIDSVGGVFYWSRKQIIRKCIIMDEDMSFVFGLLASTKPVDQIKMLRLGKILEDYHKECRKTWEVHARVYQEEDGIIETHVRKTNNAHIIDFIAPWGETQPLKMNDTLILMEDQIYRVAQQEFQQTYELCNRHYM